MSYHTSAVSIGSEVSWGISQNNTNLPNGVHGVVVGVNLNKQLESAPCRNELGTKIGEAVYDSAYSGSITVQIGDGTSLDGVRFSDTISVGGRMFRVKNVELTESNQDYRKYRLSVESSAVNYNYTFVATGISG